MQGCRQCNHQSHHPALTTAERTTLQLRPSITHCHFPSNNYLPILKLYPQSSFSHLCLLARNELLEEASYSLGVKCSGCFHSFDYLVLFMLQIAGNVSENCKTCQIWFSSGPLSPSSSLSFSYKLTHFNLVVSWEISYFHLPLTTDFNELHFHSLQATLARHLL